MKPTETKRRQLENVLKDVYRSTGASKSTAIDPQWKTNVLRQIRLLHGENTWQPKAMDLFNQTVWRLAPVAGGLVVILAVWLYNYGMNPDLDMASLALNNPAQFSLFEMFGM